MNTATTIVTIGASAWVGFSAYAVATSKPWVVDNLADYGVPRAWWPRLALVKALGAVGMLAGLIVPAIGVAAAIGTVLYFLGAVITVVRARAYAHIPFPLLYLAPAAAAGWLLATN